MMLTEEDVSKSALRFLRANYSEGDEQRWEFEAVRWDGTLRLRTVRQKPREAR